MDDITLRQTANEIRLLALRGIHTAQSGHPGGSLSIAELLAVLYFEHMDIDPGEPRRADRDRLVLSKGHAAPAYYAALALRGYFPTEELDTLRRYGSRLQGHPNMNKVPGVDMSTGSLGQGLSAACGMALAARAENRRGRVYAICGDGELQEGQMWEAAMTAAHYHLGTLTLLVDSNGLQIDGAVAAVMGNAPLTEKLAAFGWNVLEIDGHSISEIRAALTKAAECQNTPTAIVCHTIKGKGVSYMENQASWHGAAPDDSQYAQACAELKEA